MTRRDIMAIEKLAEEVVNEVANNFEEVADATRKINVAGLSYFTVGLGVGAAVGFYFGYKLNREKIRAEAFKEAEAEIDQLRKIYQEKTYITLSTADPSVTASLQGTVPTEKPPVERVVEQLGYSATVPQRERPLPAPVPILDDLPENPTGSSKSMNAGWNYETELMNRNPDLPYVIHQNEYNHSNQEYSKVEFTYYAIDDMIIDTEDERPVTNGDAVVGMENLKFGHGSDDANVVYVRNDLHETDMRISRINESFEEEVLRSQGLEDDENDDDDDDDS
jgi:hypothetical protein